MIDPFYAQEYLFEQKVLTFWCFKWALATPDCTPGAGELSRSSTSSSSSSSSYWKPSRGTSRRWENVHLSVFQSRNETLLRKLFFFFFFFFLLVLRPLCPKATLSLSLSLSSLSLYLASFHKKGEREGNKKWSSPPPPSSSLSRYFVLMKFSFLSPSFKRSASSTLNKCPEKRGREERGRGRGGQKKSVDRYSQERRAERASTSSPLLSGDA